MWRNKLYNKRIVLLNNVFFCEESKVSLLQSFLNDFRCSADTAFEFLPSIISHLVQLFRNSRKLSLGFKVCRRKFESVKTSFNRNVIVFPLVLLSSCKTQPT